MTDLIINFNAPKPPDAWLRMEEVGRLDPALTNLEAAHMVNAAHGLDLCGNDDQAAAEETEPISAEELIANLLEGAETLAEKLACVPPEGDEWQTKIKVAVYPTGLQYTMVAPGCQVSAAARETLPGGDHISITGERAVPCPVTPSAITGVAWSGQVFDMSGRRLVPPEITVTGTMLAWGVPVVGTLAVSWLEDVTVHTVTTSLESALVMAFYASGAEALTIRRPDAAEEDLCPSFDERTEVTDPCIKITDYLHHCKCGGGRRMDLDYTTREEVDCADQGDSMRTVDVYVDCSSEDPDDPFFTADYYEEVCCHPPGPDDIPPCKKRITTFTGEGPPDGYPDGTVFVPVNAPSGPCGTHTEEWVVQQKDCCDEVAELTWSDDNPEVISGGAVVQVEGGSKSLVWTLSAADYHFENGDTVIKSDSRSQAVYAGDDACGSVTVTVVDDCQQSTSGVMRNLDNGRWDYSSWFDAPYDCGTGSGSLGGCNYSYASLWLKTSTFYGIRADKEYRFEIKTACCDEDWFSWTLSPLDAGACPDGLPSRMFGINACTSVTCSHTCIDMQTTSHPGSYSGNIPNYSTKHRTWVC